MSHYQPIQIPVRPVSPPNQPPFEVRDLSVPDFTHTPLLKPQFYEAMPHLLQQACLPFQGREKDSFLLAALTALGTGMNTVHGVYDGVRVRPFLFLFVVAPAGSGKGSLVWARRLLGGYHSRRVAASLQAQQEYQLQEHENRQHKRASTEAAPPFKLAYIPGNSSAAAFLKALKENEEWAGIFESEADTLAAALKQDWGDFSDLLRKAYHHEPVSFLRKSGEHFELDHPALSMVLSGTPGQVKRLIPDAENGLFSRFLFYCYQTDALWRDVSPHSDRPPLDGHFAPLIDQVTQLALALEALGPIQVTLSGSQWTLFNEKMELLLTKALQHFPPSISSTVYRLGLAAYRMAIILTILRRYEHGSLGSELVCADTDFILAVELGEVLLEHALQLSTLMPKTGGAPSKQQQFYEQLPVAFTRAQAQEVADRVGIKTRSLTNYLGQLTHLKRLTKVEHGQYRKA